MQYSSKEVVEAIQYTGSNEEEVKEWVEKNTDFKVKFKETQQYGEIKVLFLILVREKYFISQESVCSGGALYVKGGNIGNYTKGWFETKYYQVKPFPKEAYELVDDFVCHVMNHAEEVSESVLTSLIPLDKITTDVPISINTPESIYVKRQDKLLAALETIKKALGGEE